jgi:trehalose synthase
MHNGLHGVEVIISPEEWEHFLRTNRENAAEIALARDITYVHDPQPIGLVERKCDIGSKWLWRCHIDITNPQPELMTRLLPFIEQYDATVFSAPAFAQTLSLPQILIAPSIDPLSDKNKELPEAVIESILERFGIDRSRPIVTQISRFDYLKDPVGVIKVFRLVRRHINCQLILAGGGATDDPEGMQVLAEVRAAAADDPDIHVIFLPPSSDIEINALQRASTVVLQKSLREGFGLTVSEALWKGRPVIATAVGGIPLQITHKYSGMLSHSIEGTAHYLKQLLQEPEFAEQLGKNGKEHVRTNFLITRHIRDYLLLFLSVYHEGDIVYLEKG